MQQECGNPSGNRPIVHKSWERRDHATKLPHDAPKTRKARRNGKALVRFVLRQAAPQDPLRREIH
jgi:hypothetical protein